MGSTTLASPFHRLTAGQQTSNLSQKWLGNVLTPWKYSGPLMNFDATAADTGNPVVLTTGTVPSDAVAVEMWVNGNASDDYLFTAVNSGILSATGVIASNVTANLLNTRFTANGDHIIIPFSTIGVAPSTIRVATGKAAARCQGRFISQAAGLPYMLASTTQDKLVGAAASIQLNFGSATIYPTGYSAAIFQIVGPGPVRCTFDGSAPTATAGDILLPGTYLLDFALHGISITALRFFLPTGSNIVSHTLTNA